MQKSVNGFRLLVALVLSLGATPFSAATDQLPGPKGTEEAPTSDRDASVAKAKETNAALQAQNALLTRANIALQAQNWEAVEATLKQLLAEYPAADCWEFRQSLGNAQARLGHYEDALQSYEKGLEFARGHATAGADSTKIKAGIGQMLTAEGNVYLKLLKTDEAIARYTAAADIDPNPAIAYFNLCATLYNAGNTAGAAAAADKAIAADPAKADAYFIKGSALYADGKMEGNKYIVPPASIAALKKYLELASAGPHADDVKAMLDAAEQMSTASDHAAKK
ncbi:MAG: tetratricopeptide repeat protein [Opitutaceae bacterium]|nr:tetratricopeptide repeat protein [Opitutaceae bacterium]